MKKFAMIMILLLAFVYAEDYVVINSLDGRDVLSGIYYANVKGVPVKFMPDSGGNVDTLAAKVGSGHSVMLIESSVPVSSFVKNALENKNNTVEIYFSPDGGTTNLDLAEKSGADSFIIVDSAYSDSALSVLPYASATDSYVILADKNNINEVKTIVSEGSVIIYGNVDAEVKEGLASLNPVYIGNGEDKFEDNAIISGKMIDEFSVSRAIIADGTFLEESMADSGIPIILTGRLVPQATYDFIKQKVSEGKLTEVMLVGNELTNTIYDMRQRMREEFESEGITNDLGITVKFAQVIPSADSGVLALDTFNLPSYQPSLEIVEAVYNSQTKEVMLTVENTGEGSVYYLPELRVRVNGVDYEVFWGDETLFVERDESSGTEYSLDLSEIEEGEITALVLVKYGAYKNSLEEYTTLETELAEIEYTDKTDVSVQYAEYQRENNKITVSIKNNGGQTAYVSSSLSVIMDGSLTSVKGSGTKAVESNSILVEEFPLYLSDEDISQNNNITIYVDYGGRPGFLENKITYVLLLTESNQTVLVISVIALIVIAGVIYLFFLRKKKKEPVKKKKGKEE